jgi:CheY-like chemotaxis protein
MLLQNIFLAEDDPDDQYLFTDALKQIDPSISCQVASNGKEVISLLKSQASLPDLIFLDLNMPLMNGFECLSRIKNDKRLNNIPVVIFTTSRNPEDAHATHQLGANVFLSKPNDFAELKSKIKRILQLDFAAPTPTDGTIAQYCV